MNQLRGHRLVKRREKIADKCVYDILVKGMYSETWTAGGTIFHTGEEWRVIMGRASSWGTLSEAKAEVTKQYGVCYK